VRLTICIPKSMACRGKLLLLGISGVLAAQPVWSQCSATPQAALASYGENLPVTTENSAQREGFRVWRTMKDPTLGRQWFWIKACGDSQQPAQLLWAPLSLEKDRTFAKPASAKKEDHLLVHLGDDVVVTQASGVFSMRLAGHALQAGELGSDIRVEVHAWNNTTILAGKISGKDEVRVGN
jgi:hypothetical protein